MFSPPLVLLKSALFPVAVLCLYLPVLLKSANAPLAVLANPVLLLKSAAAPVAVFWSPALTRRAPAPRAVLRFPVLLLSSENTPTAVLDVPCGEGQKSFLAFCRVAPRIASIWRSTDRSGNWRKCKEAKRRGLSSLMNVLLFFRKLGVLVVCLGSL